MLEHTKKPLTESVELRFIVPASQADAVRKAVAPFITEEVSATPWRQALDISDAEIPGRALRGARHKEGLTQIALAKRVNVPQRHISEMENNKRPVGKEMARRLAAVLDVDYRIFL